MARNLTRSIEEVIKNTQPLRTNTEINVIPWLNDWYENKKPIMQMFGDKLIWRSENPITIELTTEEKNQIFENEVLTKHLEFGIRDFLNSLSSEEFFNNKTNRPHKNIPANTKVLKALKYFHLPSIALRVLQDELSMVIQKQKITGYLYFSVHPLDYLSISDNAHGWSSCHSMTGDYAAGNISYMCDRSTIVCYLASDKFDTIPNFPFKWNSKKWRVLLHISDDKRFILMNKEYPFSISQMPEKIQDELNNLPVLKHWNFDNKLLRQLVGQYTYPALNNTDYIVRGAYVSRLTKDLIVETSINRLFFSDIEINNKYQPKWFYTSNQTEHDQIHIGHDVVCPICNNYFVEYNDVISCHHCLSKSDLTFNSYYTQCEVCNNYMHEDDAIFAEDGNITICKDCYTNYFSVCQQCEGIFRYDTLNEDGLCEECVREMTYS